MFSKPNSCLLLIFLSTYLTCSLSQQNLRLCDTLFHCGNISAGFPFWGNTRPEPCGHPSLVLHCDQSKNKTYMIISGQMYSVLQIDKASNTLRLARQDFLGESFCSATFTGTTLTPELFELSSDYKTLFVYYLCDTRFHNHANFTCPKIGVASVHKTDENLEKCGASFNITVPNSYVPEEEALNLTRLGSVLRNGFKVKLKFDERPCRECQSSGGICGYDVATQVCCKTNSSSGSVIECNPIVPYGSSVDERHKHCTPLFKCGNQTELYYPFWTHERKECGHPDFEVDCSGEFPEFSMLSVKFQILEMNYLTRIVRLARTEYLNNLCPHHPENATINQQVFSLVPDTELQTFYYDCSGPKIEYLPNGYISHLGCEVDVQSYFVSSPSDSKDIVDGLGASCERIVYTPVSRSALKIAEENRSLEAMKTALGDGFMLMLNSNCSECVRSQGACGYNESSKAFVCYCINEPHAHTCRPSKKRFSKKQKIGIGFTCGFLGATLLVGGLFCFIIRRRKNMAIQYTSKALSTPSTPYSSTNTMFTTPTSTTISSSNHSLLPSISNIVNRSTYDGVQLFSYEELAEATKNFTKELGDGGFGTVYYGVLKDGREVAVKRLYERSLKRVEQFKNEIDILKSLKHPNLVILYGCTTGHSRELLLVYEYVSNGTLAEHLHGNHAQSLPICWHTRLNIAIQTASALSYLHTNGIIHRDVKTTNILLDNNNQVKVADFGLSRLFPKDQTHISTAPQGTPGYVDPEYYQCYRLNEKSDVYSFGVVLSELLSSKEAVDITRHRHEINLANLAVSKIQNDAVHELVDISLGFEKEPLVRRRMMSVAELAFRCLQHEREVRPSMDEVVEVLRGVQKEEEVVEINVSEDHSVPPPLSPVTEGTTSSSNNTTMSSF